MARNNNKLCSLLGFALGLLCAGASNAAENYRTPNWLQTRAATRIAQSTDRLIVKYKSTAKSLSGAVREKALSAAAGQTLRRVRSLGDNAEVVVLPFAVSNKEARKLAAQIQTDPNVEYAEPDYKMFPALTPSDPGFSPGIDFDGSSNVALVSQWYLSDPLGGINAPSAWSITTGSAATVIAVIDTGVLQHADLSGRLLDGYDFIGADPDGSFDTANDGNGRDTDATDPGNWITPQEAGTGNFSGCGPSESDWHGTHIAGIIGANANNGQIAGINWAAKILPVRVLGKCGGYSSDIVDGMRWSVGIPISNVPDNLNPANIVNLSLGIASDTGCSRTMQSAINDVLARGATVIVAAGNGDENGRAQDSSKSIPANCVGVVSVSATVKDGQFASTYSNFGPLVSLSAPGGLFTGLQNDFGQNGILSLNDRGTQQPLNDAATAVLFGTSFSTAIVSGVASLIQTANPNLTPVQMKGILQATARLPSNPTETGLDCGLIANHPCQQYVVDAAAAVNLATSINNGSEGILQILDRNGQSISALDFGSVNLRESAGPQTISVRNAWSSAIRIDNVLIVGQHADDFFATTSCANAAPANKFPFDLAAGSSCEIDVTFTAQGTDVRGANAIIVSNVDLPIAVSGSGPQASSGDSAGGSSGGCAINRNQRFDPLLLGMLLAGAFALAYRRRVRR